MSVYSGYLGHKRKAELEEIAQSLRVPAEGTKAELEAAIRQKLAQDERAREDPRFSGISGIGHKRVSPPSDGSPARRHSSSSSSDNVSVVVPTSPAKQRSLRRASGMTEDSRDLTTTATDAVQKLAAEVMHQAHQAPETVKDLQLEVVSKVKEQLEVAKRVDAGQIVKAASAWARAAEVRVGEHARAVQSTLSHGWTVVALSLAVELAFVLVFSVPYTKEVEIGHLKWWSRPWTANTPYTLTIPDLFVLKQSGVLRPIAAWVLSAVVVPFIAAHLVVFPTSRPSKRHSPSTDYPLGLVRPSSMTFSIIRLALGIYFNKLAGASAYSFTHDILQRFGDIQILSASVALAFATYELLAGS